MENEVKVEKNKRGRGLVVLVVILSILVLGLAFYIAYDKGLILNKKGQEQTENKKDVKDKEDDSKEEKRELTVSEKEKFEDVINKLNQYFSNYYPISNPKNIIGNDELLSFALTQIGYSKQSFTGDDVNKIINNYFGSSVSVTNKDIICPIDKEAFYTYNASTNTYAKSSYNHGHDGTGFMEANYFFESGYVEDEKTVTINSKIVYLGYRSGTWGPTYEYYSNYNDAKNGTNPVYKGDTSGEGLVLTDELYQSIKDNFPTTTFTFEKNSDGYYDLKTVSVK